ncbi:increased DNA methylation 1-like [Populus alba]
MGFGILCHCCNCEVSPSTFKAHAGWATRKKPYACIYTSNGVSLHDLAISLSKSRKYSSQDNDDLCIICADGGDLLICDGCPRAFHKGCASLSTVPSGNWCCQHCQNTFQRETYVEHNANAFAAGRVSEIDSVEQITKRCFRIVKNVEG